MSLETHDDNKPDAGPPAPEMQAMLATLEQMAIMQQRLIAGHFIFTRMLAELGGNFAVTLPAAEDFLDGIIDRADEDVRKTFCAPEVQNTMQFSLQILDWFETAWTEIRNRGVPAERVELSALRTILMEVSIDVGLIAARHGITTVSSMADADERLAALDPQVLKYILEFQRDKSVRLGEILEDVERRHPEASEPKTPPTLTVVAGARTD